MNLGKWRYVANFKEGLEMNEFYCVFSEFKGTRGHITKKTQGKATKDMHLLTLPCKVGIRRWD